MAGIKNDFNGDDEAAQAVREAERIFASTKEWQTLNQSTKTALVKVSKDPAATLSDVWNALSREFNTEFFKVAARPEVGRLSISTIEPGPSIRIENSEKKKGKFDVFRSTGGSATYGVDVRDVALDLIAFHNQNPPAPGMPLGDVTQKPTAPPKPPQQKYPQFWGDDYRNFE